MAKPKTSIKYQVVGKTSDGVKVLKPKVASGHLREMRAKVERMMAANRQIKPAPLNIEARHKARAK